MKREKIVYVAHSVAVHSLFILIYLTRKPFYLLKSMEKLEEKIIEKIVLLPQEHTLT